MGCAARHQRESTECVVHSVAGIPVVEQVEEGAVERPRPDLQQHVGAAPPRSGAASRQGVIPAAGIAHIGWRPSKALARGPGNQNVPQRLDWALSELKRLGIDTNGRELLPPSDASRDADPGSGLGQVFPAGVDYAANQIGLVKRLVVKF
jgi:hypothetical protein